MRKQRGNISVEYLLATMMIIAVVFGVKVGDQNLWGMFQEAFQTRHDNYSSSISNLDNVNVDLINTQRKNETNK